MHRCSSWPPGGWEEAQDSACLDVLEDRKLWMLSPELEQDLQADCPQVWRCLQSQAGRLLQATVLALVVCTYAACPLTVSWAKVVGMEESGPNMVPIKGRPFKESSVIVTSWLLIALSGLVLSSTLGGKKAVRRCLDPRAAYLFAPAGVGWALADVCEVLAVARIDPATYGVISQARLLGSALACWLIRGMEQTRLQWGVLLALSLVCMAYCLVPDDPVSNHEKLVRWRYAQAELRLNWYYSSAQAPPEQTTGNIFQGEGFVAGVLLALMKVILSVVSGVYGETCFKLAPREGDGASASELHVQMTQIAISATLAALLGYLVICLSQGESPLDFFGGPDGFWDGRTVLVAVVYCWREWICNLCVKRFDSLVKNICNAVALVVTYGFTVAASREKPFSPLKGLILLAVVIEVVNYVATRRGTSDAPVAGQRDGDCKDASVDIPVGEYRGLTTAHRQTSFELKEAFFGDENEPRRSSRGRAELAGGRQQR